MPIFLDRHDLKGLKAADIAEAHRKDLEVQDEYGVRDLLSHPTECRNLGARPLKGFEAPVELHDVAWR